MKPWRLPRFLWTRIQTYLLAACLAAACLPGAATAADDKPLPPHVLILSSYHLDYTWSDDIIAGIKDAFADLGQVVEVSHEFLDTKRHDETASYQALVAGLLAHKYRARPVDLVLVCDNSAFDFIAAYGRRLFADVPVVFCGINDYTPALHAQIPNSTGVAETKQMGASLDLMQRLQPRTRGLAMVSDDTLTGRIDAGLIRQAALARGLEVTELSGAELSLAELLARLRQLPPDSAVFFGGFWRDRTGTAYDPEEILPRITQAAPAPVYTHADTFVTGGVVGGVVVHGHQQGYLAGEMAVRILRGTRPGSISVASRSNVPFFDHAALERWGIDPGLLPAEAVVVNRPPPSLYERYAGLVWAVSATFIVLLALVGGLAVNIVFRRRAEAALRAKTGELERYFTFSLDLLCIADTQGRFLRLNPEWQKTLGYTVAELENRVFLDFVHPDDRDATLQALTRLSDQERVLNFENRYRHKDGSYRWIEWRSVAEGRLVYAVARDITRRKRAGEALRASEERFRLLAELAPVGIVISDKDERTVYVSPKFVALFGYTEQDIPTVAAWWPLAYPDQTLRHRVRKEWAQAISEAKATNAEIRPLAYPVTGKDGRVRQIEIRLKTTGTLNVAVFSDITERKRAEDELKKRELLLNKIFDVLPIGLWFADRDGTLLKGNPAGVAIWGAEPTPSLLEYGVFKARRMATGQEIPPDDWALVRSIKEGLTIKDELLEIEAFDGRRKIILNYSAPVLDDDGRLLGAIVMNTDVTAQKEAEAERERLEGQLAHSQKMESVGRLAGGVAHDFNNMLGVILGHTELALETIDDAQPLHAALVEIRQAARRSADLTRQLLAFARKQIVSPRVLDLNETVEGMLKMLGRLIGEDIDLAWLPGENLGPVRMDPSQIDQILANLCVNARDAIGDTGKVTIETHAAAFDEAYCAEHAGFAPGAYVLLAVSDNGCGMDAETRSHLFEPFFTTKGVGQGTGLGLATVYGIVTQNNGFINVYSEPGQGTTIRIYLPRHASRATPAKDDAVRHAARGHETILLVEDEPMILKMARMMLERHGYTVLTAVTPGEAIQLAEKHAGEIHLLMTDVVMPGMNGRELARYLLSCHPNLTCLFMSGYTADVIAQHGVLDKGVHFLQKPFSMHDLTAKVREALEPH